MLPHKHLIFDAESVTFAGVVVHDNSPVSFDFLPLWYHIERLKSMPYILFYFNHLVLNFGEFVIVRLNIHVSYRSMSECYFDFDQLCDGFTSV